MYLLYNTHILPTVHMIKVVHAPGAPEGTDKPSLVQTVEAELLKQHPHTDVICGLVEQITGTTADLEDFHGQMLALRNAGKVHYLLYLKVLLEQRAKELRASNGDKQEIERLEMHAVVAEDAYNEVRQVEESAGRIKANPAEIAPTGSPLTQQGDLYRAQAKGILKAS